MAPALFVSAMAGCVDEPVSTLAPGDARVVFASEFSFSGMTAGLPIEAVRLTPTFHPDGGAAGEPRRVTVDSNADQFEVDAIVDLGDRDSATILIRVELLSTASGADLVEWSAEVGPIEVVADETVVEHEIVELIRGPIENRGVVAIAASGPSYMPLGSTHPAMATVETTGPEATIIWSSSDESIVEVDPVIGDSVDLFAHDGGYAWIYAGAGAQTDSFLVFVDEVEAGPVAAVFVLPDSAMMVVGSSRTLNAFAVDSLEIPVATAFSWTSLDEQIATVSSSGVVTAHQIGFTQVVVTAAGISDTADISVQSLPAGVDVVFVGGTPGAEFDWFTADNWSPARVPTSTDVVYISTGTYFVELDGNTEIGGLLADSTGAYSVDILASTLTVNGDIDANVLGDSTARVIMTAPTATLRSLALPNVTIQGDVDVVEYAYVYGDLQLDGAGGSVHFDVGSDAYVIVQRDFSSINASIGITENDTTSESGSMFITGDALFDGGDLSTMTGGTIDVGGDLTVTGACGTFNPEGGDFTLYSDTTAVSISCSGLEGNRFHDLYMYQSSGAPRVLELLSDVYVRNEAYLDGGDNTVVYGNGHTFQARSGSAYWLTFDHTFVQVAAIESTDEFYTDSIFFTGMTGETRPQVRYSHPGVPCLGCYGPMDVRFDPTSSGPYLEVIDDVQNGDTITVYVAHNPGDGPARTVTTGEAVVHWADVPTQLLYWSGSGQTGTQHQPLPDSLVAEAVDYAFYGVDGVAVDWTVRFGDGSVSPSTSITDEQGLAATQYTVGDTMVSHEVIATTAVLPGDTIFYSAFPTGAPPAGVAALPTGAAFIVRPTARPAPAPRLLEPRPILPPLPERPELLDTGRERR